MRAAGGDCGCARFEHGGHGAGAGVGLVEEGGLAFEGAGFIGLAAIAGEAQEQAVPERLEFGGRPAAPMSSNHGPAPSSGTFVGHESGERGAGERGVDGLKPPGELRLAPAVSASAPLAMASVHGARSLMDCHAANS